MSTQLANAADGLVAALLYEVPHNNVSIEAAVDQLLANLGSFRPHDLKASGIALLLIALLAKRVAELEARS